jgi:hypothetical protein
MYKLGQRPHHKQKLYAVLILLFTVLIIIGFRVVSGLLEPQTTLSDSEATVRHVDVVTPPTKEVNTPIFSMTIPRTWQAVKPSFIPAAQYAWRGSTKDDSPRSLELYVDTIPTRMAVNKLLPLRSSDNRIVVGDSISDNCVSFTDSSKADKKTATILAKWSDVNFYCDTGNYARNVVGTGSPDAINSVTLTGPKVGVHRFFFVYTDNGSKPDYTIFTDLLNTFRVH